MPATPASWFFGGGQIQAPLLGRTRGPGAFRSRPAAHGDIQQIVPGANSPGSRQNRWHSLDIGRGEPPPDGGDKRVEETKKDGEGTDLC